MSEALLKQAPILERPRVDALAELLPPIVPAEVNDNEQAAELPAGEQRMFEIPARLWLAMVACYAVFLTALLAATAGGESNLNIAISAIYMVMFFGTIKVMLKYAPAQPRSPFDGPDRLLQTLYGPLKEREVAAQMLVVPACIAFFGVAILVIRSWVA